MSHVRLALLILTFALLAIFVLGNAQPVRLQFLTFHTAEVPLFLVLLGAFLAGFVVAWIWSALGRSRKRERGNSSRPAGGPDDPSNAGRS